MGEVTRMSRRTKSGSKRAQSMYMGSRQRSSTVGHNPFDDNTSSTFTTSTQNFAGRMSPRGQKRNWFARLSPAGNKREKQEEPLLEEDGIIYLKELALVYLSSPTKKKRPLYKPTEITLSPSRISLIGQKQRSFALDSILTFELEVLDSLRITGEKRTGEQRVLLIVTANTHLRIH